MTKIQRYILVIFYGKPVNGIDIAKSIIGRAIKVKVAHKI